MLRPMATTAAADRPSASSPGAPTSSAAATRSSRSAACARCAALSVQAAGKDQTIGLHARRRTGRSSAWSPAFRSARARSSCAPGAARAQAARHQPSDRRPGLLGAAAAAVEVPGRRRRRAVQPAAEVHLRLQVDGPGEAGLPALRPGQPAGGRRDDDHRPGRERSVHRARRDRLHRPRPVPDRRPLPARQGVDGGRAPAAVQPQAADHPRRSACGADHQTGTAPSVLGGAAETALGRGFATMSHALDNAGHNCNLATEAESLVMTKEYLIERYGTLRYTIGTGCSGGSLAQQWIANAYPGVYQGILPTCSFPDAWSTATQFLDYHLTLRYLDPRPKWGAGVDLDAAADGRRPGPRLDRQLAGQRRGAVPRRHPDRPVRGDHQPGALQRRRPTPAACAARSRTRRSTSSARACAPSGRPQEKQIGRGFAGVPDDNVGVQYGLGALRRARSRRPSSSTSTRRSAASTRTPRSCRSASTPTGPRWPTPTAAA